MVLIKVHLKNHLIKYHIHFQTYHSLKHYYLPYLKYCYANVKLILHHLHYFKGDASWLSMEVRIHIFLIKNVLIHFLTSLHRVDQGSYHHKYICYIEMNQSLNIFQNLSNLNLVKVNFHFMICSEGIPYDY